jgi:arylsulfatase A
MKKRRRWILFGWFLVAAALVIAALIRVLSRYFTPDTFALQPETFRTPAKAAAPVSTFINAPEGAPESPNIIVILADDLGYGDISCQGNGVIQTPHIDRMAAEGMRFTACYAAAPVCSPSRAALLTGRYAQRAGIITALPAAEDTWMRSLTRAAGVTMAQLGIVDMASGENMTPGLPPSEITIPEALAMAGYQSCAIGKWHLGDFTQQPAYHPFNHGFDTFTGFNQSNDDWPVAFWHGEEEIIRDIGIDQERYTRLFTEEAISFIESAGDSPFFLYLAHKDPHQPFFPSAPFAGKSDGGPYGDAVAEFDWSAGEILDTLRQRGIAESTLVIVTSDNGPWYEGGTGGLRGRKGQSYEGGFRVPFIAWRPGRVPADTVNDTPIMLTDLFPSFLAMAGLEPPADRIIDGEDISPLLRGKARTAPERSLLFFHGWDIEAIRRGAWKFFRSNSHYTWPVPLDKKDNIAGVLSAGHNYQPPGADESIPALGSWPMLYHIARDPEEAYNITEQFPDITRRLADEIENRHTAFLANPRGWK